MACASHYGGLTPVMILQAILSYFYSAKFTHRYFILPGFPKHEALTAQASLSISFFITNSESNLIYNSNGRNEKILDKIIDINFVKN